LTGLTLTLAAGCGTDNTLTFQPASAQVPSLPTLPTSPGKPSFLYVQRALSGSLTPRGGDEFTLRLRGAETTTYVSDRPARQFGSKPTAEFVAQDFPGFGSDPPNAVLELAAPRQGTVVELLAANIEGEQLVYVCRALPADGARYTGSHQLVPPQSLLSSFGAADLFVDDGAGTSGDNTLSLTPAPGVQAESGIWVVPLTSKPALSVRVTNTTQETLNLETNSDTTPVYIFLGPCPPGVSQPGGFFDLLSSHPQPGDTVSVLLDIQRNQDGHLLGRITVQLKFVAPT